MNPTNGDSCGDSPVVEIIYICNVCQLVSGNVDEMEDHMQSHEFAGL